MPIEKLSVVGIGKLGLCYNLEFIALGSVLGDPNSPTSRSFLKVVAHSGFSYNISR